MIKNKVLLAFTGLIFAATSITTQATIIAGSDEARLAARTSSIDWSYATADALVSITGTDGQTQAYADYSGDSFLPTLKAYAESTSDSQTWAHAAAVQGFNYTGTEASTFTLDINLHGSESGDGYIKSSIGIIIGSNPDIFYWASSFGTAYYEPNDGNSQGGISDLWVNNGTDVNTSESLSFEIAAGESFFVLSHLTAIAENGIADAMNTLTMSFDDSTGLQSVYGITDSVSVPEPSTFMLFFIALTIFFRRKFCII